MGGVGVELGWGCGLELIFFHSYLSYSFLYPRNLLDSLTFSYTDVRRTVAITDFYPGQLRTKKTQWQWSSPRYGNIGNGSVMCQPSRDFSQFYIQILHYDWTRRLLNENLEARRGSDTPPHPQHHNTVIGRGVRIASRPNPSTPLHTHGNEPEGEGGGWF